MISLVNQQIVPSLIRFLTIFITATKFGLSLMSLYMFSETPNVSKGRITTLNGALIDIQAILVSETMLGEVSL